MLIGDLEKVVWQQHNRIQALETMMQGQRQPGVQAAVEKEDDKLKGIVVDVEKPTTDGNEAKKDDKDKE